MSKAINLSGLKTLLEPLVYLINKKAERPDWNENDPSSSSYIAGRTHYETIEEQTINASFTIANGEVIDPFTISLVIGESYTIEWDGVKYNCVGYIAEGPNSPSIGNGTIAGASGGNGEPFFITVYNGQVMVFGEDGDHTFSCSTSMQIIHKIDEKYLPEIKSVGKEGTGEGSEIFNDYENNIASGEYSHVEGAVLATTRGVYIPTASGRGAHSEGLGTTASGDGSHSEGSRTEASGHSSHAEGERTIASGSDSHAEGALTIAASDCQHVQGRYNIEDANGVYAHIVGNGDSGDGVTFNRKNIHTLDWDGNAWYAGDVYVGSTSGKNKDDGSKKLATEEYVTSAIEPVSTLVGETPVSEQISTALVDCGMLTLDPNDTTISGEATPINADTLGGLNYDQVKTDIVSAATEAAPVQSVNGKTGAVTLAASDVGALPTSGGTLTGALTLANGTWNMVGDDVYIGDHNIAGAFCVKPANTEKSSIVLYNTDETVMNTLTFDGTNPTWNGNYIYHQGNKPTYADIGAAAASHTHNVIATSTIELSVSPDTTNPYFILSKQGIPQLAIQKISGNANTAALHWYNETDGSWLSSGNIWSSANLGFNLSGTTLHITKY